MSTARDSKKRLALTQLFAEVSASADVPDEMHIVPTGKWQHPVYGEMEITSANIAEFVQNFRDKIRRDIPITAGHDNGMSGGELPAIGWFKELTDRGVRGLYAVVEWTEEGKTLLTSKAFKYFSPEFYEEYDDPETHEVRHHVLVGGALTNKPYFKELEPVVAQFSEPGLIDKFNEHMDLKTILAKKFSELTEPEKAFMREHKSELQASELATFAKVFDEGGETAEEKATREAAEKEAAEKKAEEERQASERAKAGKLVTMSEAEVTALRTAANQGAEALKKIEASEREAVASKLIFSTTNTAGRFFPKQKDAIVELLKSLSEAQRAQFAALIEAMPKADLNLFKETGDGGSADTSAAGIYKEIKSLADAKVTASEGKILFSDALRQVYAEKPELKANYEKALSEEA